MAKAKMNSKLIIIIIVILVALVAVFTALNRPNEELAPATLTISQEDTILHTFTIEEIQAMPSISVEKYISSASKGDESGVFTGVPIADLINAVDPALLQSEHNFIIRAEDGFAAALSAEEVNKLDDALIVYAKDGQSLGSSQDGGSGPLRLIIKSDPFGNRSAKYVNKIEVQ
jgi:hypothetical protein